MHILPSAPISRRVSPPLRLMRFKEAGAQTRQGSNASGVPSPTDADGRRTPREQTLIQTRGGTGDGGERPSEESLHWGVNPDRCAGSKELTSQTCTCRPLSRADVGSGRILQDEVASPDRCGDRCGAWCLSRRPLEPGSSACSHCASDSAD